MLWRRHTLNGIQYADEVGRGDSAARGEILTISVSQDGAVAIVTVTTNLTGTVYFHWYRNGRHVGVTPLAQKVFYAAKGDQLEIDCIATRYRSFDGWRHAPASYHGHRRLEWLRSADSDVRHYLVQYQQDGGDWTTFAKIAHKTGQWSYGAQTPLLDDGSTYGFRVVPVDTSSLEGTPLSLDTIGIVRRPDVTEYALSWSAGTGKVTFSAA